ncbi:hypothetical protein Emin_1454 [Elusimicrobium minutum Pei191]|uniref:Abortive infection protein-like C-terminal domain-containing protein n=1 Tax=Elusimicrobium minutum (strain Pei191) TaxID=445932 RepID=B2KEQ6_ELUMP|nr:abortive infection family protein [Elusimicrobium minutum]ACC99002.1 hypothetical protein Emin_1454 [Elusimicrobium minutum Pei191]
METYEITEITRRAIIDEFMLTPQPYHGKLEEVDFLERLYPLAKMPSTDGRFSNAGGDIYQHRINNFDWPDEWIWSDSRFNLLRTSDQVFTRFICEMLHPVVRHENDVAPLLAAFNRQLANDNWEIYREREISKRPVFAARKIGSKPPLIKKIKNIDHDFIAEQIKKSEEKLDKNDFDGAITNARSLVEAILCYIAKNLDIKLPEYDGDLFKLYKTIRKDLKLEITDDMDNILKQIITGLSSIISGLSGLSNKMGDRHVRQYKPNKHHAKLAVNVSQIFCEFLLDSYEYQKTRQKQ